MKVFQNIIGAESIAAISQEIMKVSDPTTGETIGHVPFSSKDDVDMAIGACTHAQKLWWQTVPAEREQALLKCADILEAHAQELADLVLQESGSTLTKSLHEVHYSASLLRTAAGETRRLYGETFPNDKINKVSMVFREPLGLVSVISPFNAPLALFIKMIAFPLAAGNGVIAKPSEETPMIATRVAQLFLDAGLPPGLLNIINGNGESAGSALATHPDIQGITFTGSTHTGKLIGHAAINDMKHVHLELGGNNSLIILKDADIEKAAQQAAVGAFFHSGQICMASSRILVDTSIKEPFVEAFKNKAESLHLGDLRDSKTAYGPLINKKGLDRVQKQIDTAITSGAQLITGGATLDHLRLKPTIILDPPLESDLWQEETFGPVAAVKDFKTTAEAIELANDNIYGLSSGIITNQINEGMNIAQKLKCGSVHLGTHSFQSDAMAPIGGYKMSGLGKSGGKYSTEAFTEQKWISMELTENPLPF